MLTNVIVCALREKSAARNYPEHPTGTRYTLPEAANALGVSCEEARQIEAQALAKFERAFMADPVIRSLVEAKVGTTTGVELPQLITVISSPAAEHSTVEGCQLSDSDSSTAENLNHDEGGFRSEKTSHDVAFSNPPSWANRV